MGMDGARRETGQVPSGSPLRRRFHHCWRVSQRYAAQKQRSGSVCQGGCTGAAGPAGMRPGAVCHWGGGFAGLVAAGKPFPGERDLLGRGVSYCVTCDGMLYRGKKVCVVGFTSDTQE